MMNIPRVLFELIKENGNVDIIIKHIKQWR